MTLSRDYRELGKASEQYFSANPRPQAPESASRFPWVKASLDKRERLAESTAALVRKLAEIEGMLLSDVDGVGIETMRVAMKEPIKVRWCRGEVKVVPWLDLEGTSAEEAKRVFRELSKGGFAVAVSPQIISRDYGEMLRDLRASREVGVILGAQEDIDALARGDWTLAELLSFKVSRIFLEGAIDADAVFSEWQVAQFRKDYARGKTRELVSLKAAIERRRGPSERWLFHSLSDALRSTLDASRFVYMEGKSASGKTILALSVVERLSASGVSSWYVDIGGLTSKTAYLVGLSILKRVQRTSGKMVVILDDLHTQVSHGVALAGFLQLLQNTGFHDDLLVLGISWPGFQEENEGLLQRKAVFRVDASAMRGPLISKYGGNLTDSQKETIAEEAGEDLLVLCLWLKNSTSSSIPPPLELARLVWQERQKNLKGSLLELERAAFVAYLINQYECEVACGFVQQQAGVQRAQLEELVRAKLLTKRGNSLSAPHRSFASLVALYLLEKGAALEWIERKGLADGCTGILLNYLESIEPSKIWSVLKLIDTRGASEFSRVSQEHIRMIVDIWRSIDALLQKMNEQNEEDPTWGRTVSSAAFACQAFCTVGQYDKARSSLEFIRSCYSVESGVVKVNLGGLSTLEDWDEILVRLRREEQEGTFASGHGLETSDSIDMDLFHANWISGLALGAEAHFASPGDKTVLALAEAVERRAEIAGYFYPARVPWVTARVLIALSLCGRSYENNEAVRRASDWLLASRSEGGARDGVYWLPGTDGWNSELETSALVIIALRSVGIPNTNPVLVRATDWIISQKDELVRAGKELDGAVALEAYLSMTGDWSKLRSEALYLGNWADSISLWRHATESAKHTHEQSCRAAQVAAFLIKAMWETLRQDLPKLLIGFGIDESWRNVEVGDLRETSSQGVLYDVAISYASEDSGYVERFAKCLVARGVKVFLDKYEEVTLWGKNLYDLLNDVFGEKSQYCVIFISQYYVRKAWPRLERQSAQAKALVTDTEYILPVRLDDTEVPGHLRTIGHQDGRKHSPEELCERTIEKLQRSV